MLHYEEMWTFGNMQTENRHPGNYLNVNLDYLFDIYLMYNNGHLRVKNTQLCSGFQVVNFIELKIIHCIPVYVI